MQFLELLYIRHIPALYYIQIRIARKCLQTVQDEHDPCSPNLCLWHILKLNNLTMFRLWPCSLRSYFIESYRM